MIIATWQKCAQLQEMEIFSELKTDNIGLTNSIAEKRRLESGYNELGSETKCWYHILGRQFRSPFIYILLAVVPLSIIFGEMLDAAMIIIFIVINVALGFFQEFKSEKMLALLSNYVVARARVRRDGKETMIPSRELVPGDIIILETGDIVPADARLLLAQGLTINESVLTGESAPTEKEAEVCAKEPAGVYEARNIVFSGTTVVGGKAEAVIIATGKNSFIGTIAKLATETVRTSGFEKGIGRLSKFILRLIFGTLILVFVANLIIKPFSSHQLIELIIFSIALAISVIPEALPVVTTFSLSRGALHLAKKKVVVKRLSAIEDLGGIDILCTDKTGTITENELTVAEILPIGDNSKDDVILTAAQASPFLYEADKEPNNAFDCALARVITKAERATLTKSHIAAEIPFDPVRRRNAVLVLNGSNGASLIVRGAYEEVSALCTNITPHDKKILAWLKSEGIHGRRVITVAKRTAKKSEGDNLSAAEHDVECIGLISFVDPLKSTSHAAISEAKNLGVTVKILTGDGPEVASAIGLEVGLIAHAGEVITGAELFALSPEEQTNAVETRTVFARVNPNEKYKIIELLQANHHVGFLGEGINDAPALKIAEVGLVVAEASDVAREAADVVLLKKSLSVIIDGIREGRIVFVNTLTYIKSTLASNLGNFYAVAVASLLIDFLPMLPLQILLLNLLSDFPMIAIATDRVDPVELKKPKQYDIKEIALIATVLGLVSSLFDFIYFAYFKGGGPSALQTNWFMGSIITELIFLFSIRTRRWSWQGRRPSVMILILTIAAAIATVIIPLLASSREVFKFSLPSKSDYAAVFIIAGLYFVTTEVVKWGYYRWFANNGVTPKRAS